MNDCNTISQPAKPKGQSQVIQFVLFFMIGISLFIGLGNFFKTQSTVVQADLIELSLEMINSHIASVIVSSVEGCSDCGIVEHTISLSKTYASHFIEIALDSEGIKVSTGTDAPGHKSSLNNLNETIEIQPSKASSNSAMNLTYYQDDGTPKITISQA